jgi:hypothetical protein
MGVLGVVALMAAEGFNPKTDIQFQNQRSLPQRHREHRGLGK